jgi:cyclopropane-fatty-acyl-phospholipid synthase
MFEQGLAERADVRLIDYRDVEGHFDRIASIEMFEAVGEEYWPAYFGKVREVLSPGGRAGLQIITIRDELFDHFLPLDRPRLCLTHPTFRVATVERC